ncbi:MAG: hypothetical protein SPM02_10335 [Bacteroidales bacterium]|nr:hypothetical protein [Bacteroidales bacterium]
MKRTPLILLFAVLLLAACDPGYTMEFAIDNQTTHAVTIQSLQPVDTVGHTTSRLTPLSAPAQTDTVVWVTGGLGHASINIIAKDIEWHNYGDSVQLRFDDGRALNFYRDSTGFDALYRFEDANADTSLYRYEEIVNQRPPFKGNARYGKVTLVVTDSLYDMSSPRP